MSRHVSAPGHDQVDAESCLNAALRYAGTGRHVLPVDGKVPLTLHGVKDATTDEEEILQWYTRWPKAGVAIATGSRSGLVVLDVDGSYGEESLAILEGKHGKLPATLESRTGGGGRHIFFSFRDGQHSKCSAGKLGRGLDVRGDGGYVVAPPSRHESGRCYEWLNSLDAAPLPAWLVPLICDPAKSEITPKSAQSDAPKIREGQRNTALMSLAGTMHRRGMAPEAILAGLLAENQARCEPPLSEAEVRRIARSVSKYADSCGVHARRFME